MIAFTGLLLLAPPSLVVAGVDEASSTAPTSQAEYAGTNFAPPLKEQVVSVNNAAWAAAALSGRWTYSIWNYSIDAAMWRANFPPLSGEPTLFFQGKTQGAVRENVAMAVSASRVSVLVILPDATIDISPMDGHLRAALFPAMGRSVTAEPPGAQNTRNLYVVADTEFQSQYGSNWPNEMVTIINRVDTIQSNSGTGMSLSFRYAYGLSSSEQSAWRMDTTNCYDLLSTYDSNANKWYGFQAFAQDKHNNGGWNYELAHLFSGKKLQNGCLGVSWEPSRYALHTQKSAGNFDGSDYQSGILAAHEIGHDFNGDHSHATTKITTNVFCAFTGYTVMYSPWQGNCMLEQYSSANTNRIANCDNGGWSSMGYGSGSQSC